MDRKYKFVDGLFAVTLLITSFLVLSRQAVYRLEFKEQIGIFLFGADRISWYLSNPAVVSCIVGDWLTQFFISGRNGAMICFLLLTATFLGLARIFRRSNPDRTLFWMALILPVMLEAYFIPFPNYPISAAVGLTASVWIACLLAQIKDKRYSSVIYGLSVPVTYVLFGAHALTLALLLWFIKRKEGVKPILCLAAGVVVMLVAGRFYNLSFVHSLIWPVYPDYIIPSLWLLLCQPLFILAFMFLSFGLDRIKYTRWIIGTLCTICFCGSWMLRGVHYSDLEETVKVGSLAYKGMWTEVKRMATRETPYCAYYGNVCNARDGKLADDLLKGRWGRADNVLFLATTQGNPYFNMIYFTDALLEMGDVSQATDCALLAQTVMPGHYSTRMLRRLAEIAVVTADYDVARKYLDLLMRTRNHREWAQELLDCIENDDIPQQYLTWRSRTLSRDHFFRQGDIRSSLSIIASEQPFNRIAVDYLLCSYLLDKNLNTFISLYDKYYLGALDKIVKVPEVYQEALLVNVNSKESLIETVEKYRISEKTVNKYMSLMEARSKSPDSSNVMTQDAMGTYWHYIMAVRFNNKEQK